MTGRTRLGAGALLALALLALTPLMFVTASQRDATAPAGIARLLPAAKQQLDSNHGPIRWPLTHYRYVATETRTADNLVVFYFEYRTYPFVTATTAYLASRCTPLDQIDPREMSGGWGQQSMRELDYLRSGGQPACS
jgi:hypothetical protein